MVTYNEPNIRLARNIVDSIKTMADLLYEIKAGTPLGNTLKTLLNLCHRDAKVSEGGVMTLPGVSFLALARTTDISENDLQKALDYLQQRGIFNCRPASGKEC